MKKTKVPFKTNVKTPPGDREFKPQRVPPLRGTASYGYWLPRRERPIRAVVVDPKKERRKLIRWLAVWVVLVPGGFLFLLWLFLFYFYLFNP